MIIESIPLDVARRRQVLFDLKEAVTLSVEEYEEIQPWVSNWCKLRRSDMDTMHLSFEFLFFFWCISFICSCFGVLWMMFTREHNMTTTSPTQLTLFKTSQQCKSRSIRTTLQHTTNILPLPLPQRKSTPISQQRHTRTHNTPTPLKPLSLHHERSSKLRSRWHHSRQLHHRSHKHL
jgi:hypothetical protein